MNIKNKRNLTIILIMGCTFLLIFKISPLFMSLGLSFKDYTPFSGFFGSHWVGFRNFNLIFTLPNTVRIFFNSVRLNAITTLLAIPIAGAFVYCANRIRSRKLALLLTGVFALAALFPQIIFAGFVTFTLGIKINTSYDLIYSLFEAVRLSGFVALAAYFMSSDSNYTPGRSNAARLTITVLAIALLAGVSKYLSFDFELGSVMQNPLIYDRTEVIDTFYYKASLVQMRFGMGSALWLMKYISELVMGALAAVGVFFVLKATKKSTFKSGGTVQNNAFAVAVCSAMALTAATMCIAALFPKPGVSIGTGNINIGMNCLLIAGSLLTSFASAALAALLAYPFASSKASHKIVYAAFLVPSLYSANIVQRYILYRSLGIVNTLFPVLLNGFLPLWMIAAFAVILNRPGAKDVLIGKDYVKYAVPAALIMGAINFSLMWGNFGPALIYTVDPSKFTAALALRNAITGGVQSLGLNLFVFIPIVLVWGAAVAAAALVKKGE